MVPKEETLANATPSDSHLTATGRKRRARSAHTATPVMTFLLPRRPGIRRCRRPGRPPSRGEMPSRPIDFSREVRPILSNYCFPCHGPDDKARKAGLRLDSRRGHRGTPLRQSRDRSRQARGERSPRAADDRRPGYRDAAPQAGKTTDGPRRSQILNRWIEQGARIRHALGLCAARAASVAAGLDPSWPINRHRPVHSRSARSRGPPAVAARGSATPCCAGRPST